MQILSYIFWLLMIIISLIFFPIAVVIWIITVLFDKRLYILHLFSSFWAAMLTWTNPLWKVRFENRNKIDPKKVYIIISNHQSLLDILVLYRLFTHYKWVSKMENFRLPIVGWNMLINRYIKINRSSTKSYLKMLRDCENNLNSGNSVLIFPEGTRSKDGKLGTFKEGAFKLAKNTNYPILPVILDGTRSAIPKTGLTMRKNHNIKVKILDEISPDFYKTFESKELMNRTRDIYNTELKVLDPEYHT